MLGKVLFVMVISLWVVLYILVIWLCVPFLSTFITVACEGTEHPRKEARGERIDRNRYQKQEQRWRLEKAREREEGFTARRRLPEPLGQELQRVSSCEISTDSFPGDGVPSCDRAPWRSQGETERKQQPEFSAYSQLWWWTQARWVTTY